MTETIINCPVCRHLSCVQAVQVDEDGIECWSEACSTCGYHGWGQERGQLDIGIIRADPPEATNCLEVFFEEFSSVASIGVDVVWGTLAWPDPERMAKIDRAWEVSSPPPSPPATTVGEAAPPGKEVRPSD